MVRKRLSDGSLGEAKPYLVKGVTWQPASAAPKDGPSPIDPDVTVPYGFFFDWSGRYPQGHEVLNYWFKKEASNRYKQDFTLMKQMYVNTFRTYNDFGDDPAVFMPILDECYRQGIMVIMTVAGSRADLDSQYYLKIVQLYKNHPAILMWLLGNEWNLDYNKYYGFASVAEAAFATNQAAINIKQIDPHHPVSSCLGDRFIDADITNTVSWVVTSGAPAVDVWGFNIYRGKSFGNFFLQWKVIFGGTTPKPFYFSEFGPDSFYASSYTLVNGYQADNCIGVNRQDIQAKIALRLWKEIERNLSKFNRKNSCLGGLMHEFSDELWKVGSYHVGVGGLVNYRGPDNIDGTPDDDTSYDEYNTEGFYLPRAHPDNVANEEYFGMVSSSRQPKQVFYKLRKYFCRLSK